MKLTRRGIFGAAAGATVAMQQGSTMDKGIGKFEYAGAPVEFDEMQTMANTPKQDPDYYINQVKRCRKILSGDFSDCMYEFENNKRGKRYANIESLKSISPSARQEFIENADNRARKAEIIDRARAQLDDILGLPFSVTGILFDE